MVNSQWSKLTNLDFGTPVRESTEPPNALAPFDYGLCVAI